MSWKSVNLFRFNSWSLVTKLTLLYSISTIGLLSAIGVFLYPTFHEIFIQLNTTSSTLITAAQCYEKIIITLLLSSFFSIILGHAIAKNGLNRMRQFENKMEKMTADSLHERINLQEWPKEIRSFAEKMNMMLDRIQTSFIQLSQFSSDIAHELRTPINNLRGITEIALAKEKFPNDYKYILESQMDEYHHLSKLIENLLFLARSDHGQLTLKKERIDARKEILNISDYYKAMADENNITLICEGNGQILVDPILFKRVISNLLSNALRHTLPKGKITIDIKSADKWVHISLHDTGTGIGDEHLSKIFDRFYREDASRSSKSSGVGLGLAIVKSIVELHKGKIHINSQLNFGTTVYLQFPKECC